MSAGLFNELFIGFSFLLIFLQIIADNFFVFLVEIVHEGLLELLLLFLSSLFNYRVVSELLHLLLLFLFGLLAFLLLLDFPFLVGLDGLFILGVE